MSRTSFSSTRTEVPAVNSAVDHLQELATRMVSDEYGFNDADVGNVDRIIGALHELETECSTLQEKLETKTIESSVLRHDLNKMPKDMKAEMQEAVNAARLSNAEEVERLQNQLQTISQNIIDLEKKNEELEKENAVLHPERDNVREEHEEIIAQLNQRLAAKASKQIHLNETRDQLRETNQKIIDLEEGIMLLKEDLIQERADARIEKKKLKKAVYNTTQKTSKQKDINATKRTEVDALHSDIMKSDGQLEEIRKSIRRFENSKSRLERQEKSLNVQFNREVKNNEELRERGNAIRSNRANLQQAHEKRRRELDPVVQKNNEDIARYSKRNKHLEEEKLDLRIALTDKIKIRKIDDMRVKNRNEILQKSKEDLALKAEDVARLYQENEDMEIRTVELGETHEAIMATLQKQIEEYREQLNKERKERMDVQDERDAVQTTLDEHRQESLKYMNDMNKKVKMGKQSHDKLTREGTQLQQALRADEDKIKQLRQQLQTARKDYQNQKQSQETQLERIQNEIVCMENELAEKNKYVEDNSPAFEDLEKAFEESKLSYERVKKDIIGKKNKKLGLEDSVKRAKMDIDKLTKPQPGMRDDLRGKRDRSIQQLKTQAAEVKDVENNIYIVGCKLKTAIEENERFLQANRERENEIETLKNQTVESEERTANLEDAICGIKGQLVTGWDKDEELEKESASRDWAVVEDLKLLLDTTEQREHVLSDIGDKLHSELRLLADFLENVSRRRPKDTRSGKKPSRSSTEQRVSVSHPVDMVADANVTKEPSL